MKKLTAILVGTLIAGSAVLAQTNQVLSRNAVGYVKVSLDSNKLYLVSNPFVNLESSEDPIVTNTYGVVPNGTIISVWNEAETSYDNYTKSGRGTWDSAAQTAKIARADGVFIRTPSAGTADLFLMGEVPDRFTAPSSFVSRVAGITMVGFPYPVSIRLTNTVLGSEVPNGSIISVWNAAANNYDNYTKSGRGTWDVAGQNADILPGQGMVIRSTDPANSWYETKPYTWP